MNYSGSIISLKEKNDRNTAIISVICLTILLYLFRTTIPFLKFPFLLIYLGLIIYSIIYRFKQIPSALVKFFCHFYIIIILAIILFVSFLLSNKLYLATFKDIFNTIILLSLFFLLALYLKTESDLKLFFKVLINFLILFGLLISVALLSNLMNDFPGGRSQSLSKSLWDSLIGPISTDFNFALLPVYFGMLGVFYLQSEPMPSLKRGILNLFLIIYSIAILFSGSRRGLIALGAIIIILLFVLIVINIKKDSSLKMIGYSSKWYLLSILFLTVILIGFIFILPTQIKRKTLNTLGISVKAYKYVVSTRISRYSTIFSDQEYSHFENIVWTENFDPLNPKSGWNSRISTSVFPLSGENVEIVPENSIGYKMDSTCDASPMGNNAYSYTNISGFLKGDLIPSDNQTYYASVYCFVSKDFDGNWVIISDRDGISGKIVKKYDLSKKGIWQNLQLYFKDKSTIFLYWSKYGVTDFSSLKGYIIFAYPQYKIINKDDSVSSLFHNPEQNKTRHFKINDISKLNKFDFTRDTKKQLIVTTNLNFENYDMKSKCIPIYHEKLITNSSDLSPCMASFFQFRTTLDSNRVDQDPIREWASKLISEDTTYFGYKNKLIVDSISNNFTSTRLIRWQFAWQIFTKEYKWKQKLFGGGFDFLNWFGYYFLKDKTFSDYPHNPFLSILLYSGIFGLLIYLIFFYKVFYYYIKYIKEYAILFIFFIITLFFSFFSSGGPFDPPVMGFFSILPFFIHYIHKNRDQG